MFALVSGSHVEQLPCNSSYSQLKMHTDLRFQRPFLKLLSKKVYHYFYFHRLYDIVRTMLIETN